MTSPVLPAVSGTRQLGILLALLGLLLFALNDVMGKWLVASYSVGQVLLLRSFAALVLLAPLAWRARASLWPLERPGIQFLRVATSSAEVYAFYFAVISLPLADVMTYWLAAPIYVAAVSPWMLGERVGAWRWVAILAGFFGVLVALRPGATALTPAVAVSLAGSFAFAFLVLSARFLRGTTNVALVFWQMVGAGLVGLATAPFGWVDPSPGDAALLCLLGVVAMIAHLCLTQSLKLVDAAVIAPLHYTLLIWAIVFGWLVFGDVPGPAILTGAAIIAGAGVAIWLGETVAFRRRP